MLTPGLPPSDPAVDCAMAGLGPFERAPRLVAAVSGGRDSTALALMAKAWTAARGGELLAFTVDHRLRPESADEAAIAGARLAPFGIPHRILTRTGPLARGNVQAAARKARYELLAKACRDAGALHLLLGHHLEDQGETAAMRAERSSGDLGLAAMAPVSELADMRLLRPLLDRPRRDLEVYLARLGVEWIDDPTNLAPSSARGRLRAAMTPAQLAALGREAAAPASGRREREDRTARLLAGTGALHD
ncbi:MAG: tRNA lysidine(34) synthetase TilS, partial [Alphaproteobacteria bacterium]|nr:tRNA lysidine(34) synthetase TilS [Alphaproteobacteria bacterium]